MLHTTTQVPETTGKGLITYSPDIYLGSPEMKMSSCLLPWSSHLGPQGITLRTARLQWYMTKGAEAGGSSCQSA